MTHPAPASAARGTLRHRNPPPGAGRHRARAGVARHTDGHRAPTSPLHTLDLDLVEETDHQPAGALIVDVVDALAVRRATRTHPGGEVPALGVQGRMAATSRASPGRPWPRRDGGSRPGPASLWTAEAGPGCSSATYRGRRRNRPAPGRATTPARPEEPRRRQGPAPGAGSAKGSSIPTGQPSDSCSVATGPAQPSDQFASGAVEARTFTRGRVTRPGWAVGCFDTRRGCLAYAVDGGQKTGRLHTWARPEGRRDRSTHLSRPGASCGPLAVPQTRQERSSNSSIST